MLITKKLEENVYGKTGQRKRKGLAKEGSKTIAYGEEKGKTRKKEK